MKIWDKIEHHASVRPNASALLAPSGEVLSYARLVGRVKETLENLRHLPKGARVGLPIEPSMDSLVHLLALSSQWACAPLSRDLGPADSRQQIAQLGLTHLGRDPLPDSAEAPLTTDPDIKLLLATSGSTGAFKSVELSHHNVVSATCALVESLALGPDDRSLGVMPLFHIHGLSALFASLFSGGSFVLHHGPNYSRALEKLRPTWFTASPGLHQILLDSLGPDPKHSLRFTRSASAAMPRTLQSKLETRLGVPHLEAYGMTETSPLIASNGWSPEERRVGSVGKPRGNELAIWGEQNQVLARGETGRIVVRGPNVSEPGWFDTGDLGYLDEDEFLFVTGRVKSLINRGGEKISPLEIERTLEGHPAVQRAACFPIPHKVLGQTVGVAVTLESNHGLQAEDLKDLEHGLRSYLGRRLAYFKLPQRIEFLDTLPLSESGKLKRQNLTPCRPELEAILRGIWQELFPGRGIDSQANFFAMGGHSILAAQLLTRVKERLHIDLPLSTIFERPSFSGFLERTQESLVVRPLSAGQKSLYFVHQRDGSSPRHAVTASLRLEGELQVPTLERALEALLSKHLALRSVVQERDGQLQQKAEPTPKIQLPVETSSPDKLESLMEREYAKPFDLHNGPLFRFRLLHLGPKEHCLLLTCHHLITDAWSMSVLREDLAHFYSKLCQGQALPKGGYAWETPSQGQGEVALSDAWQQELLESPPLKLGDGHTDEQTADQRLDFGLSANLTTALRDLSASQSSTLFTLALSAFLKVCTKYSKQEKFLLAVPTAKRTSVSEERAIDLFAEVLLLPLDAARHGSLRSLQNQVLKAQAQQTTSYETILRDLNPKRDESGTELVTVMFAFQNTPWKESYSFSPDLKAVPMVHRNPGSKFHLTLYLQEREGHLSGSWHYNTSRLTDTYVKSMSESFVSEFEGLTARTASAPVSQEPGDDVKVDGNSPSFLSRWRSQVANHPERLALVDGESQLSYGELDTESEILAQNLQEQGLQSDTLVALQLPRNKSFFVAVMALWKTGAAYLALEPLAPQARKDLVLQTACPAAVLHEVEGRFQLQDRACQGQSRPGLAYVMMTSGSTGVPKAVAIGQKNVAFYAQTLGAELGLTAEDAYLHTAPLTFSSSVRQFTLPWACGATVVLAGESERKNPEALLHLAKKQDASIVDLVPSVWRAAVELWRGDKLERVRLLLSASEAMPGSLADQCLELAPQAQFVNMYGQTETTGIVATYAYDPATAPRTDFLPLGRALSGNRVIVLDKIGESVPLGVWGEIAISGAGLGLGYLEGESFSNPFLTGDLGRFDSRGLLQFGGRLDSQMKVRGHRLEPGDIEHHLNQHPAINEVAVSSQQGQMLARVVGDVTLKELRPWLAQRLPTYMHPTKLDLVSSLARTESGKIKRHQHKFSELETQLLNIWKQVLKVEDLSTHDNFFDRGGDSLLTLEVVAKARTYDLPIELKDLFEFQTIAQLSQHISNQTAPEPEATIRVPVKELRQLCVDILREAGLADSGAQILTDVQLESSLRGQQTHNIGDIPRYAARLRKGILNPHPVIQVQQETSVSAVLNGDNGPGQWVATVATELALEKAKKSGLALVSCKNSNHFGAAGHYAWLAAEADMVAFCTTNGPVLLAPTGGVTPLFGNNPIAFGVPNQQGPPMVLDMALSVAPRGKIGLALKQGQSLAQDWILDALGRPTTELADLAAGLGVPIGAHKGYGLALAMEILAGVMSGAAYASDHSRENLKQRQANIGHFFLVIKPGLFLTESDFKARISDLIGQVKGSVKAEGTNEILIPGELELRARAENLELGVPLRESVYQTLLQTAKQGIKVTPQ